MRAWWLVLGAVGCGRFGFGHGDSADSALDTNGDGANGDGGYVCPATFDLCDDFEAPAIDGTTWTLDPNIALDKNVAHRGTQSVHVHTSAFGVGTDSYTSIVESKTLAVGSTFWVRGWFLLSALPAGGNGMELIVAEQTISGPQGDYIFVFNNGTHVYSQFASSSQITVPAPANSWFCVVWKVVLSKTTTGSLELTGDFPTTTLANVTTDGTTPVGQLAFGMGFSGTNVSDPQPAFDLWIDDVIVHRAPVTCTD